MRDVGKARLLCRIEPFHLEPDFRHRGLARAELRAAHALAADRRQARLRRLLAAEHAEGHRPAKRPFVLDDEVIVDREGLELGRLLERGGAAWLWRDEYPPAGRIFGAPLREARAEAERLEGALCMRQVGEREASPFEALECGRRRADRRTR